MAGDIAQTLNQPFWLKVLLFLAKNLSPGAARVVLQCWSLIRRMLGLVDKAEKQLAQNLQIALGTQFSRKERKQITRRCFFMRSLAVYDFYHYQQDPQSLRKRISMDQNILSVLADLKAAGKGAVVVSPHCVSSDIIGVEFVHHVEHLQVISIANPPKSYQLDNQVREAYGVEITPASMHALRQAATTLKNGNFVATAIDRAYPEEKIACDFFGKPAFLPTYYIRLALHYQVPVIFLYGLMDLHGNYHVKGQGPIWLKEYSTPEEEVTENSKRILPLAEEIIRKHPNQWCMFHPLWADQFIPERTPDDQLDETTTKTDSPQRSA